jgi:hypothetical protein
MRISSWLILLITATLLLTHPDTIGAALTAATWLLHTTAALLGTLTALIAWRLLRPRPPVRWVR